MKKIRSCLIAFCLCVCALCIGVGCAKNTTDQPLSSSSEAEVSKIVTVTFDTGKDRYDGLKTNQPAPQELEKGELVEKPNLVAAQNPNNYEFDAWYTSTEFETEWDFETDTVTEDMTLYAKWVEMYDVSYYVNGTLAKTDTAFKGDTVEENARLVEGFKYLGSYTDENYQTEFD